MRDDADKRALTAAIKSGAETADYLRELVNLAQGEDHIRALEDIAEALEGETKRLTGALKAWGELPPMPDPERENLEQLATRIRAALAGDRDRHLLAAAAHHLAQLIDRLREEEAQCEEPAASLLAAARARAARCRDQLVSAP